jgi:transcriptional regulator with XRE-family HTH domain
MTQAMLADHAELTREHLSEVERGKKEIGVRTLDRIARALGMSLAKFFEGF